MITISYKSKSILTSFTLEEATIEELIMTVNDEGANRDDLMRAFQQFLSGIGFVFPAKELRRYER